MFSFTIGPHSDEPQANLVLITSCGITHLQFFTFQLSLAQHCRVLMREPLLQQSVTTDKAERAYGNLFARKSTVSDKVNLELSRVFTLC